LDSLNLNILNRAKIIKETRDAARLSEESVVTVCPNPKCRREIEESILLTDYSVTPAKEYEACPYCFTKLEPELPIEQEDASEPTVEQEEATEVEDEPSPSKNSVVEKVKDSSPGFLQRVKALIPNSNGSQKEKIEKPEEPQAEPAAKKEEEKTAKEEPETEPIAKEEEPKEEPKTKTVAKKEAESSGCPESFGYLANRPPDAPIPPQCLVCPKMVDCMLSPRESETD
jgi:hypothetical protein